MPRQLFLILTSISRLIFSSISVCIMVMFFCSLILLPKQSNAAKSMNYKNPELSIEKRVEDLISRMTIEEKIAQMDMLSGRQFTGQDNLDKNLAKKIINKTGVGSIHDFYPSSPELVNELTKYIIDNNRFGIPPLVLEETLHGFVMEGSTTFPVPLALASTWNPELVENVGHTIAAEARAQGTTGGLSPVLGIARDPRWGRVEETFGEDTYLVSLMGQFMVRGFQGNNLAESDRIASVIKHFAVHSMPTSGSNSSPVVVGKREALQFFLPPFESAVKQSNARGVMTAYSEWNGIPCTGDDWLLTEILREQWKFNGFTIADMGAIRMLSTCHFTTESPAASLTKAVSAGVDMQFYDFPSEKFRSEMKELMDSGKLKMADLDRAVKDILRLKFELGLFDNPYIDTSLKEKIVHSRANQDLALQAARESIVLLKNDGILPIDKSVKRIALIGPAGNSSYTGGYSPIGASAKTILDGLNEIAGEKIEIKYVKGVSFIDEGLPIPGDNLFALDKKTNGLTGSYFNNIDLQGEAFFTRIDDQIDFYWDTHSPADGMPPDSFSIRWEGYLSPDEDFDGWIGVSSDDGSRLWLDDKLVIDTWDTGVTIRRHQVNLQAGSRHKIRMEYRENLWGAAAGLRWSKDSDDIQSAVELAKKSDIAILALGENDLLIGENRDRLSLEFSGRQSELLSQVAATGTPVVLVLSSGRPIALGNDAVNAGSIIAAWFGGENAGTAIAEALFGKVNPSGRLPITFPKFTGQIPCNYNRKPSKIMRYSDGDAKPQYAFGHGLSYTSFEYNNLQVEKNLLSAEDTLRFSINIKNNGNLDGTTVVQVYINDLYSSVTTPLKELKSFKKVWLKSGQEKTIHFEIPVDNLSLIDANLDRVVEPGTFILMVGKSSDNICLESTFEVIDINQ